MRCLSWLDSVRSRFQKSQQFHSLKSRLRANDRWRRAGCAIERLEDRITPAITALTSGGVVIFATSGAAESITFGVDGGGYLKHNKGGVDGLASAIDLNSILPGNQVLLVSDIVKFDYVDADATPNDAVTFDGHNFEFSHAGFLGLSVQASSLSFAANANLTTGSAGADITLVTDQLNVDATATIDAGTKTVSIRNATSGRAIDLGGADSGSALGLSDAELDRITAGVLQIGRSAREGDVTVTASLSLANVGQLEIFTSGKIVDGNTTGDDITVARLGLSGSGGVGTSANPLDVVVSHLEAASTLAGIFVSQSSGSLTVGGVSSSLTGINAAVGAVTVAVSATSGTLTLDEQVRSSNSSAITLVGDKVAIGENGTVFTAGSVTIWPQTSGRTISLGGSDSDSSMGLTDVELDRITADKILIGTTLSGSISVDDTIEPANANQLHLFTGGAVIDAHDEGVDLLETNLAIRAVTGIGTSDNPLETSTSRFEAKTTTGGIFLSNSNSALAIGGGFSDLFGVQVSSSGNITITNDASITLDGSNIDNVGTAAGNILLQANGLEADIQSAINSLSSIVTQLGHLTLVAGRDILLGSSQVGKYGDIDAVGNIVLSAGRDVIVDWGSWVDATGTGAVSVHATRSVHVINRAGTFAAGSRITTVEGSISLSTGLNGRLVVQNLRSIGVPYGIVSVGASGRYGEIVLNADQMTFDSTANVDAGTNKVTVRPVTSGRSIQLGPTTDLAENALELSDAELDKIKAGQIVFETTGGGDIAITADIAPSQSSQLVLNSSGDISDGTPGAGGSMIVVGQLWLTAVDAIDVQLDVTTLAKSFSGGNQFLDEYFHLLIGTDGLSAETGSITLNSGTFTSTANEQINDQTDLIANGSFALGPYSETIDGLSGTGAIIGASHDSGGALNVGANNADATFDGQMAGNIAFSKIGTGTQILTNTNEPLWGTTITAGELIVNGSLAGAIQVLSGAVLGGTGTFTNASGGGTIAPGNSTGIITLSGDFQPIETLRIEINGTTVGTQHDQVVVTGLLDLSQTTLDVVLGYEPEVDDVITILSNVNDHEVAPFAGLPEGAPVLGGKFRISYNGGTTHDVVLLANHAPTDIFSDFEFAAVPENNEWAQVTLLRASDPDSDDTLRLELPSGIEGADNDEFQILVGQGEDRVLFNNGPLDADIGLTRRILVRATDLAGNTYDEWFTIQLVGVNDNFPVITSVGAFNTPENQRDVGQIIATDADLPVQTLSYAITGGADAARFTIDSATGALSFIAIPNYEAPTDADLDNVYRLLITVSDNAGSQTDCAIAVTVTDLADTVVGDVLVAIAPDGILTSTDVRSATNEKLVVSRNGERVRFFDATAKLEAGTGVAQIDEHTVEVHLRSVTEFRISGSAGNDTVIVDFTNGSPLESATGGFDGGAGNNSLIFRNVGHTLSPVLCRFQPTSRNSGLLHFYGNTLTLFGTTRVNSVRLEGTAAWNFEIGLPTTNDTATLSDVGKADSMMRFSSPGLLSADFSILGTVSLSLKGNGGNDRLTVSGVDPLYYGYLRLEGENGNDTLNASATKRHVVLIGGDGNDTLTGGGGDDRLYGDSGNDLLKGMGGSDWIFGGDNDDTLNGGVGNDILFGDSGNDRLLGGDGNDAIRGQFGDDRLEGGNGHDTLFGDEGRDTILGQTGNDLCLGGDDDDSLDGGTADKEKFDTLAGGPGEDSYAGARGLIDELFTIDFNQLVFGMVV